MTAGDRGLADRIVAASELFETGDFSACHDAARRLLDEVSVVQGDQREPWRAQLLGLIGKSALHLARLDEALTSTQAALQGVRALNDARLYPLLDGYRENLLTILAALEPPAIDDDSAQPLAHRTIRRAILHAQALTDRFRFERSLGVLEPLRERLHALTGPDQASPHGDVRVWYLPRVLGLAGFNWFRHGDRQRARARTTEALELSRALDDRTGTRVYTANLARIDSVL